MYSYIYTNTQYFDLLSVSKAASQDVVCSNNWHSSVGPLCTNQMWFLRLICLQVFCSLSSTGQWS